MIGIIDYKAGNSPSVLNACRAIGAEAVLVRTAEELRKADKIILPGVGSARATMDSLNELGIVETLEELVLGQHLPFLGICVGLQILFEHSEEGDVDCLGWIKGRVKKFDEKEVKVPQIGWNKVEWKKKSMLNRGVEDGYFYFVNSYYAVATEEGDVLGKASYGQDFLALVEHENIYASQCHLEKSGALGLTVLKNFCGTEE